MKSIYVGLLFLNLISSVAFAAEKPGFDTDLIESITQLKGKWDPQESVFKITQPRNDVPVVVDGRPLPPFMGLTSWASFTPGGKQGLMVMGDLVLFEDEVNPVMDALFKAGLEVTALHNHFFYAQPKVYFMHVGGEGTANVLSKGVAAALDQVRVIRGKHAQPVDGSGHEKMSTENSIQVAPLEKIFGLKGTAQDGMVKFTVGRKATMPCGCEVGKEMGLNTWAAFGGTDANAAVSGDFAVLESELQPALRALRKAKIDIVAIHQHMSGESPRYLFFHYWGRGRASDLALGIKAGLQTQEKSK